MQDVTEIPEYAKTHSIKLETDLRALLEPLNYLLVIPGKEIRSRFIDAINVWLNVPKDKTDEIKDVVKLLHSASMLIDDIEDNSTVRRGSPAAHLIYGQPLTINCANLTYFIALEKARRLGNEFIVSQLFVEEVILLHRGQGLELYYRDNLKCPTEEEYRSFVKDKTGGLFRLSVRLLQAFSTNKKDFMPLVDNMGIFFQIRDDYVNLQSQKFMLAKSFCEDITEGKFSFPAVHSIATNPKDQRLLNILRQKTEDIELKKYAVELMKNTGSFAYTKTVLLELQRQILEDIERLGGNKYLVEIINYLMSTLDS